MKTPHNQFWSSPSPNATHADGVIGKTPGDNIKEQRPPVVHFYYSINAKTPKNTRRTKSSSASSDSGIVITKTPHGTRLTTSPLSRPHESGRFPCDHCDAAFATKSGRKLHMRRYHAFYYFDETFVECPVCDATLQNKSTLNCHLRETHTREQVLKHTDLVVPCLYCDKVFASNGIRRHLARTHPETLRIRSPAEDASGGRRHLQRAAAGDSAAGCEASSSVEDPSAKQDTAGGPREGAKDGRIVVVYY